MWRFEDWRLSLTKIGIKPSDAVLGKGIIRLQKLVDELKREIDSLKSRVTELEK